MSQQLDELRARIDELDSQLLKLLAERVKLVLQVGDYKRERGVAVYDAGRERSVLDRLAATAPAPLRPDMAKRIFERIIDESRSLEQQHVQD